MVIYTQPRMPQNDQPCARELGSNSKPVDLVHLGRQSLGDHDLELEILALFRSQSKLFLERLKSAKNKSERKMAAHTILGSARGIGAWEVAECASVVELNGSNTPGFENLSSAIKQANTYISEILED